MSVKDDLIAAKALIDTSDKWGKGWGADRQGRDCAASAVVKVCPAGPRLGDMLRSLGAEVPEAFSGLNVWHYNDAPATTHADIMALFDRAIEAAS